MNLYIKQKVFSLKDKFNVYDVQGNNLFYVESELLTVGKKLHVYDNNGNEVAYIHQKVLSFLPRYFFGMNGTDIAEVKKKLTLFSQKYDINGLDWTVDGDYFAHEYVIRHNYKNVAIISKKWLTWGDTYEICVLDEWNTLPALCVVLIIDAVISNNRQTPFNF